jgi:hypothetical protein
MTIKFQRLTKKYFERILFFDELSPFMDTKAIMRSLHFWADDCYFVNSCDIKHLLLNVSYDW